MTKIDMQRVREALPKRAKVLLKKKDSTPYIYIEISNPSMYEKGTRQEEADIEMVFDWLRDILGRENISEFYRISTGSPWQVWLKRKPYEFVNLTDADVNSFSAMPITKMVAKD